MYSKPPQLAFTGIKMLSGREVVYLEIVFHVWEVKKICFAYTSGVTISLASRL